MFKEKSPLLVYLVISKEQHKDGGFHHHVYWEVETIHTSNNARDFDFCGVHPNIEVVTRTPHTVVNYVKKDNDIQWEEGTPPHQPSLNQKNMDKEWLRIIDQSTSAKEFLHLAATELPNQSIKCWNNIKSFAEWKFGPPQSTYESPQITVNYSDYPELKDWVDNYVTNNTSYRPISLILFGASRLGKTLWARSLANHAYFPGMFMLSDFHPNVNYAVFDDLIGGFSSFPNYKQWFGQREFVATDKYKGKQRVMWGKPCIYIANEDPRRTCTDIDWKWMDANAIIVEITTPLCTLVNT
ncbi:replication initiation protein [Fusarium graminearum gemytripvirus 1]|uniref:Replication initiation protein n=1 Tax=Fusarium graminearum gemytripvirus 1 TaxID=2708635 RepID=A0A6M3EUN8_9VIRU|nr:Rep [Fusarium graminearum gemytripvirus 1]QIA59410.1 replication initiation protein [Fusarium graminearum gemytripvirus 1]